ncbi:hypothetical protein [Bacillus sp. NPDC077027]|uniref:hypothetical protein n=1 Tax=Bacillus sp. NPDC077027 TaxID=3390548 RepID=UPI003CFE12F3
MMMKKWLITGALTALLTVSGILTTTAHQESDTQAKQAQDISIIAQKNDRGTNP